MGLKAWTTIKAAAETWEFSMGPKTWKTAIRRYNAAGTAAHLHAWSKSFLDA